MRAIGLRHRLAGVLVVLCLLQCTPDDGEPGPVGPTGPKPSITTTSLPIGIVGLAYEATLSATGGDGSYRWSISAGALPSGLSLSSDGVISGLPARVETCSFSLQVTSGGQAAAAALSITTQLPPPPSITTSNLPTGMVGHAYSYALTATGGDGSYQWSIASGALPIGLSLSAEGVITGTPSQAGTASFTVEVASAGEVEAVALSIVIEAVPPPVIVTASLPDGTVGQPYSELLAAVGGDGGYSWSIAAGELPGGLDLSPDGVVSGMPSQAETATFTVQVASAGQSDATDLSITILPQGSSPSITTTSLPDGTVGQDYDAVLAATGGDGTYIWSLSAGALPAGLSLSAEGLISGTPSQIEMASFTVEVTSDGQSDASDFSITVQPPPPPSITTSSLPAGIVGRAYSATLAATGGDGSYSWSLVAGALPPGLGLSSEGVISGTPSQTGTSAFTVRVTSAGKPDEADFSLTVGLPPPPSITTTNLPNGMDGQAYSAALSATGGDGSYSWSISAGALPAGLSLSIGGVISGIPSRVETTSFTVQVMSAGQSDAAALSITVDPIPPVSITTASLPGGTVGEAYSQTLTATGGIGGYSWSISAGSLPAGLSLSAGGVVSGTPSQEETATFTVEATSAGLSDTADLSMTVEFPALVLTTTSLPNGTQGDPYSETLTATGGDGSYVWSISTGALPSGLSLSADGVISGTPDQVETASFSVEVASAGQAATADLSITVEVPPPVASVEVLPPQPVLQIGGSAVLTAILKDASGEVLSGRTVAWASSSSTVVSMSAADDQATVTALTLGFARISATSEGVTGESVVVVPLPLTCETIAGGEVWAIDGQFLGSLTPASDPESLLNTSGAYGSATSGTSMYNPSSTYGSASSQLSAFNPTADTPPRLFVNDFAVASVSTNASKLPRIDPIVLRGCTY